MWKKNKIARSHTHTCDKEADPHLMSLYYTHHTFLSEQSKLVTIYSVPNILFLLIFSRLVLLLRP